MVFLLKSRSTRNGLSRPAPSARFTGSAVFGVVVLLGASLLLTGSAYAAQAPVNLETAGSFAILAGSGITNTGQTTVSGDVGTFPTPTETGFGSLTLGGANHDADAVTQQAKRDMLGAYSDAASRAPATSVPVELGGSTLKAGVYTSPTFGLTGTLTLDGQGDPNAQFVFQAGSTLITASNSNVLLENGAQACNVVWQVGSSATFGTDTDFIGNVLSHTSITAQTGSAFQGRLLASNGAVTLDTNTITAENCAARTSPSPTPTPSTSTSGSSPTPTPTRSTRPTPTPTKSAGPSTRPTATSSAPSSSPSPVASATSYEGRGPGPSSKRSNHRNHRATGFGFGGGASGSLAAPGTGSPGLPFTGLPTLTLLTAGLALLFVGGLAVLTGRRGRRQSPHPAPAASRRST